MTAGGTRPPASLAERLAARERVVVVVAIVVVAVLGMAATMDSGRRLMAAMAGPLGLAYFGLLFIMWWSMMMAMMLPSAAPAILVYGAMRRSYLAKGHRQPPLSVFVAGYAVIWTAFSVAVTILQIGTASLAPLSPMFALTSGIIGGLLLLAAGLYQFTPLKTACLHHCQSPFFYLARHWRQGGLGAFRLGLAHGMYCLGCCWMLMGLLFYGGVMEPIWILGIAGFVGVEKLSPVGGLLGRLAGLVLIGWALVVLVRSLS